MKLRNKKTGKIIEYSISLNQWSEDDHEWYLFGNYDSIDELKEDWEDYEPLIKDEKIRKALRYWAEANNIKHVIVFDSNNASPYVHAKNVEFAENAGHLKIVFRTEERFDTNRIYTIEELCGEEE